MQKIKEFFNKTIQQGRGKDILMVLIVILVGTGSFLLGRLSKADSSSGIKIEYPGSPQNALELTDQAANALSATKAPATAKIPVKKPTVSESSPKAFFASSRGSKYYPAGCSAGKSIKQENRVYFATREEAQIAGYELSSSCR